ncbi:Bet v1-like protein [Parathielavia hyrcaniae]|uniref:Bet v1-like protein n=1 Tax=Parathielavia hyrcaniae TaxID=113614 RepID=A0AAN6T406_9PEZI|nr:Bet v1-like protein [Parathielavia hyrcaniae]
MAAPGGKAIATTNEVMESALIRAPLSHVWHFIKLPEFHKFWSSIDKAEHVKGTSSETDVVKWTFKDGSVIEVKQDEHSNLDHFITYSVINTEPELTYSSVVSTIRCWPVTSGEFQDCTFVRWTSKFSSDADLGVLEDAKYKRRDALKDLGAAAAKMIKKHAK